MRVAYVGAVCTVITADEVGRFVNVSISARAGSPKRPGNKRLGVIPRSYQMD